jgi:ribose-phosphate pyrophosphokinase
MTSGANCVVAAMPGNETMARALADRLHGRVAEIEVHRFGDGETSVRFPMPVPGATVAVVSTMDRPDAKFLPLVFAAQAARDMGAARVGLVAPYLAYMRQDKRFREGDTITSRIFAHLLSRPFDFLVTVDPHLHRYRALSDIYTIPATVAHAAPLVREWIASHVKDAVLVGPDEESRQWVADTAAFADLPFFILDKTRRGDREVSITGPDAARWKSHVPVLVDDIISTGATMCATVRLLESEGFQKPVCIGVHAVFAEGSHNALLAAGASSVVTTNTIPHPSNAIDVSSLLAQSLTKILLL